LADFPQELQQFYQRADGNQNQNNDQSDLDTLHPNIGGKFKWEDGVYEIERDPTKNVLNHLHEMMEPSGIIKNVDKIDKNGDAQ